MASADGYQYVCRDRVPAQESMARRKAAPRRSTRTEAVREREGPRFVDLASSCCHHEEPPEPLSAPAATRPADGNTDQPRTGEAEASAAGASMAPVKATPARAVVRRGAERRRKPAAPA